jgi:hypothetical protein
VGGAEVGTGIRLFQDMSMVKPPGGREKPWHQDGAYFNLASDTPVVGVWIALGHVTKETGAMHLLPGLHTAGPQPHFKRRDWQICDGTVAEWQDRVVRLTARNVTWRCAPLPPSLADASLSSLHRVVTAPHIRLTT